ncbi:hypothetical protein conserved [Leishmania donovani]|uniref:Alpha-ketoglutarate-dependent dioxygenase alkB homolog 7, mitochondrial n=3 Tax=Leishmania donovani species complex TaxID=38574 RepID=A0A6L0XJ10_LEIIN|nr:conserved hypothetical protein [Leishmania infantum JPCM5]TPP40362.1 hypothetical protein CGC20_12735 [Leishmania donovani]CAC9505457.1 hypothetical_protein_-_conserved [Leishmania infantum]CAJ1990433.1 hypothetical protein conserved [Leishmania donovani]CAM69511.1 conserved hypothetical protein [Leishmania infantum JPCM5]SUZ43454.1 hypothetical_protein_-_conserved [Leishmania infantum]|eukprot:XP_001470316.1 conserved hypothetical protein [Leishmania infantum JPCM5]
MRVVFRRLLPESTAVVAAPSSLLSMRGAPSFVHPPAEEAIGKDVRATPANWVTAYVLPEVITEQEEKTLLDFSEPWFERLSYSDGHMDGLIHHYKEFYRSYAAITQAAETGSDAGLNMPHANLEVDLPLVSGALARAHDLAQAYLPRIPIDDRVHFLRLAGSGFIRAHVDESRNSTGIVAGLCLNAGRVMTLTHPEYPGERVELMLAPRCLYILIGRARYDWAHSVDWIGDDDEHIRRIQKSLVVEGTPIRFDGAETPYRRFDRTAIIFRGVSPMTLLARRMRQRG